MKNLVNGIVYKVFCFYTEGSILGQIPTQFYALISP